MLASHNILNPANGAPYTFSGYGLGLYYMTKERLSTPEKKILGQDLTFYSAEEVNIALNEGRLELNARVRIRAKILMKLEN
jgi:DNA-directed RNA polymerase subunit beta'